MRQSKPWGIIVAAGYGRRIADSCGGMPKQFLLYRGAPLYWQSALTMSACGCVGGLVFVFAPEFVESERQRLNELNAGNGLGLPFTITAGGRLRQDSVFNGINHLAEHCPECSSALVHDAARPFVSPALVRRVCAVLDQGKTGAIPALAITDTVKEIRGGEVKCTEDLHVGLEVGKTLDRQRMVAVQTPQGFDLRILRQAHLVCREKGLECGDDAAMLEEIGMPVSIVPGEPGNIKITSPDDLALLDEAGGIKEGMVLLGARPVSGRRSPGAVLPCSGFGYDVHRYAEEGGRPMKLGGVSIPNAPEVLAHSDGDVLLHALADAILGCSGAGDIGALFPDSNPDFSGLNSAIIVDEALRRAEQTGVDIVQADLTIVAQIPKISPQRAQIRRNVARILQLDENFVNVKATTEEGLGFTGSKTGIKAYAMVSGIRLVNKDVRRK